MSAWLIVAAACCACLFFAFGIRTVRPTHRGLVEVFGKYERFAEPGFHWVFPFVSRVLQVNTTEQMTNTQAMDLITSDSLNITADAQVFYRVSPDEASVKASQYGVKNYQWQMINLACTALRCIIGTMTLKEANGGRSRINAELSSALAGETRGWGVAVIRSALMSITPPLDVREAMNGVVKAENERIAAADLAGALPAKGG